MRFRAITWNLFHGRDAPPDPALHTLRSRLLGASQRNATHVQVNRELFAEFAGLLAAAEWDIALLQECPPRWPARLAEACDAEHHRVLTARNGLGLVRGALARANPDLLGAHEGGSNSTLVRAARRPDLAIVERRELVLRERRPERRTMAFTRLAGGLCVANLHATNDRPPLAEAELLLAAEKASEWAGDAPLLFGGDLNLRPAETTIYRRLSEGFGLSAPQPGAAIDHLLVSGLEVHDPPSAWPAARREVDQGGLALRLSDHAPVEAAFGA